MKLGFLGWKLVHSRRVVCRNSPQRVRYSPRECTITASPVSCSCVFFTRFCFELAFGANIKVVDNWVIFLMALEWLKNVLWILSYDKNTPSVFWENHPLFRVLFTRFCFELAFGVNMKVLDNWVSFPVALVWLKNNS